LKIRQIKVGELKEYLQSNEYKNTVIIPITPQRAESHIQNPRADKEDVALILAEEDNGNVLGFIGLLPDFIFEPEQKKVFWISCWWAHPEKGKSLGVSLLLAAYQASNGLLLADASPDTLAVFRKSKMFHVPDSKPGIKLFLKPLINDVLLRKRPNWKKYSTFLSLMDWLIGAFFLPLNFLQRILNSLPKGIEIESVKVFNIEHRTKNYFNRNNIEYDWIARFRWILDPKSYSEKRYYPFSKTAVRFKNHFLAIKYNGIKIASLFMTERDGVFKLHYLFTVGDNWKLITKSIIHFLATQNAKEFITFNDELTKVLSSNSRLVYARPTSYQYVFGKGFEEPLDTNGFQYGDGDAIFT